jgi:RNA polymerase sigma factor (TIGR02999 family)
MPRTDLPEINELLAKWGAGDREAIRALIPLLYEELRRVARQQLRRARSPRTLQTTALVNEAYMRLHHQFRGQFQNKSHFIAVCALLMRQILVGYERDKRAAKRGGGVKNCTLEDVHAVMKGQLSILLPAGWMAKQWIEWQEDRFMDPMYWHEPFDSWRL